MICKKTNENTTEKQNKIEHKWFSTDLCGIMGTECHFIGWRFNPIPPSWKAITYPEAHLGGVTLAYSRPCHSH